MRKASTLTLRKVWVDPASGPAAVTLHAAGNDANAADADQIVSTSPTGQSITIDVLSGETVSVSEAFDTTAGKLGAENYNTTLLCTGGSTQQSGVLRRTVAIADSPSPITCTFTNTRKSTTLTLQKAWVKPVTGDQVTLSIDGTNDDTSGAVIAPATTETASTTVYAGETVTVSEAIAAGNTAIYDVDSITLLRRHRRLERSSRPTSTPRSPSSAAERRLADHVHDHEQRRARHDRGRQEHRRRRRHVRLRRNMGRRRRLPAHHRRRHHVDDLQRRARAEAGRLQRRRVRPDPGVRRHQRHLHRDDGDNGSGPTVVGGQAVDRLDRPRRRRDRHLHVHQHRSGRRS